MTELFRTAALTVLTPYCYDQYFVNFNFFHGECMKATISKALGLVIVAGSVGVRVPQILKIMKNKSGEGISLIGCLFELVAITTFFAYSYLKQFPFSAWGDGLFLAIQVATVLALVFYYKKQQTQLTLFVVGYTLIFFLVIVKVIPINVFWLLQVLNLPIIIVAKGAQILSNYKNQSTGQLSFATYLIIFGGALARIFTSFQDTGDMAVIMSFVVAAVLNGVLVLQFFIYDEKKAKKGKGKSKGKKSD